ncbi:HprK-related kinase B [Paraglaciecola aquimarina]|uniref:HprK-related kinase B n=1 Tax=Paraglaciecola aquimarina TaxID=1235557 RepID=A0ABU3T0P8_9ALTE|nr:HprK-related kinase B [Paraglaciecola aquimarina]MDU0355844.1 HprK-related kinase B [Paraglaciecola aquimarina]
MNLEFADLAKKLGAQEQLVNNTLLLEIDNCVIQVKSNSDKLLTKLTEYFGHVVCTQGQADLTILAIEKPAVDLALPFKDWQREAGKTGRKDSYYDLAEARIVHKVKTGMCFMQSETVKLASGPCIKNDNQVINFINSQYLNWLQQQGWQNCHAAALERNGQGIAMAGFSGGGKSTLMLHLMELSGARFTSNDRLLVKSQGQQTIAKGIPKLPRVNPGTVVNNPRLKSMFSEQKIAELQSMPLAELWDLEEKYDVFVEQAYGPNRICHTTPLKAFIVLNWHRDNTDRMQISQIDLTQRRDLLAAVMKSSGPFYQYNDGSFYQDSTELNEEAYLQALHNVPIYEASGQVDFAALVDYCDSNLLPVE